MTLRYLLDENIRGTLGSRSSGTPLAFRRADRNRGGASAIDPDLPLGTTDPAILTWAEIQGKRI